MCTALKWWLPSLSSCGLRSVWLSGGSSWTSSVQPTVKSQSICSFHCPTHIRDVRVRVKQEGLSTKSKPMASSYPAAIGLLCFCTCQITYPSGRRSYTRSSPSFRCRIPCTGFCHPTGSRQSSRCCGSPARYGGLL